MLLGVLTAACAPPSSPQALPDAAARAAREPPTLTVLPLKRGYYVASDTLCAQASNASLLLLGRDGVGGARYFCEFRRIELAGPLSRTEPWMAVNLAVRRVQPMTRAAPENRPNGPRRLPGCLARR